MERLKGRRFGHGVIHASPDENEIYYLPPFNRLIARPGGITGGH
jgi:hypothetical protein